MISKFSKIAKRGFSSAAAPAKYQPSANAKELVRVSHGGLNVSVRSVGFNVSALRLADQISHEIRGARFRFDHKKIFTANGTSFLELVDVDNNTVIGYDAFRPRETNNGTAVNLISTVVRKDYRGKGLENLSRKTAIEHISKTYSQAFVYAVAEQSSKARIAELENASLQHVANVDLVGFSDVNPTWYGFVRHVYELSDEQRAQTQELMQEFYRGAAFVDKELPKNLYVRIDPKGNVVAGVGVRLLEWGLAESKGPNSWFVNKFMPFMPYTNEISDGHVLSFTGFLSPFYKSGASKDFMELMTTCLNITDSRAGFVSAPEGTEINSVLKGQKNRGFLHSIIEGRLGYYGKAVGSAQIPKAPQYPAYWDLP